MRYTDQGRSDSGLLRNRMERILIALVLAIAVLFGGCRQPLTKQERSMMKSVERLGGKVEVTHGSKKNAYLLSIDLSGTEVADSDLSFLSGSCSRAHTIDLSDTGILGSGIPSLSKMGVSPEKRSFRLKLARTKITDSEIHRILAGKAITELNLSGTKITDACIPSIISNGEGPTVLDLSNTKITLKGLQQIGKNSLYEIKLQGVKLDDKQIPTLARVLLDSTAKIVDLKDTGLTPAGIEDLRRRLEEQGHLCEISGSNP